MEKFSFNDVLALLLPGLFILFCIQLTGWSLPADYSFSLHYFMNIYSENDFLNSVFYLLLAVVSGGVVQKITVWAINRRWYNRLCGLYLPTGQLFSEDELLQNWLTFYNEDCRKLFEVNYDGSSLLPDPDEATRQSKISATQAKYFDYIYYYMMSKDKLEEARTQQNFYYMFRNLFTISFLTGLACSAIYVFIVIKEGWNTPLKTGILALLLFAFGFAVCRPLGRWYRKRMLRLLFYLYYLEKTTASS